MNETTEIRDGALMTAIRVLKIRFAFSLAVAAMVGTTCGGSPPELPAPTVDAQQAVAAAAKSNPFPRAARVFFKWSIREPNLRVGGDGVARLEPPDRARLDLFLGNGQSALAVALVDDDLRAPEGTALQVVPSPPLLWASLGVFRPGDGVTLLGAEERDEALRLRYALGDGDELWYELRDGKLTGVELLHDGSALHRVALDREVEWELPRGATYRNLASFRELKITVESVEHVESYPADIWSPHR